VVVANRIRKMREDANSKLGSVVTNLLANPGGP
jgi:hypothetical protein